MINLDKKWYWCSHMSFGLTTLHQWRQRWSQDYFLMGAKLNIINWCGKLYLYIIKVVSIINYYKNDVALITIYHINNLQNSYEVDLNRFCKIINMKKRGQQPLYIQINTII